MHRNPTLLPGSKGRLRATIKKNPDDKTTSVPMLIFNQYNADVDGDRCYAPSLLLFLFNNLLYEEVNN
jgi:hypothetical protein